MTLSPRIARYDQVLLDLDGCLWVGEEAVEGAAEAVAVLREAGKAVAFLTNDVRHAPEEFVRKLWRLGWRKVKRLRRRLERLGYEVFIAGDLNRTLRFWQRLGEKVISHIFDHIFYPDTVELLESWTGDPNGSDHRPLFGRFRFKAAGA